MEYKKVREFSVFNEGDNIAHSLNSPNSLTTLIFVADLMCCT